MADDFQRLMKAEAEALEDLSKAFIRHSLARNDLFVQLLEKLQENQPTDDKKD